MKYLGTPIETFFFLNEKTNKGEGEKKEGRQWQRNMWIYMEIKDQDIGVSKRQIHQILDDLQNARALSTLKKVLGRDYEATEFESTFLGPNPVHVHKGAGYPALLHRNH